MAILLRARKMLWGRSANRCAICRVSVFIDTDSTDNPALIGEEAHIVAQSLDGPRGDGGLPLDQRDLYENFILLCANHHRQIDDQPDQFTSERLINAKSEHEQWVRESLDGYDPDRQADEEMYAGTVDSWLVKADIDEWNNWTSSLMLVQPRMSVDRDRELLELRQWLLSRIWSHRYSHLENGFLNFRLVLDDFQETFRQYVQRLNWGDSEILLTRKIYHIQEWDPPRYHYLLHRYNYHVDLVHDLLLELTRAANYICDMVREFLMPSFRITQGAILIDSGPYEDFSYVTHRVEYRGDERVDQPYQGIDSFLQIRETRDVNMGKGQPPVFDPSVYAADE